MKTVRSLLVIDDNPSDIDLCRIIFSRTGQYPYIFSSENAEEALHLFLDHGQSQTTHPDRFPPTLLLLDINMPGMDGFGFLEKFKEVQDLTTEAGQEATLVVMVSSSTDPRDVARAKKSGLVVDYIQKPPTKADARRLAERYGSVEEG